MTKERAGADIVLTAGSAWRRSAAHTGADTARRAEEERAAAPTVRMQRESIVNKKGTREKGGGGEGLWQAVTKSDDQHGKRKKKKSAGYIRGEVWVCVRRSDPSQHTTWRALAW